MLLFVVVTCAIGKISLSGTGAIAVGIAVGSEEGEGGEEGGGKRCWVKQHGCEEGGGGVSKKSLQPSHLAGGRILGLSAA